MPEKYAGYILLDYAARYKFMYVCMYVSIAGLMLLAG